MASTNGAGGTTAHTRSVLISIFPTRSEDSAWESFWRNGHKGVDLQKDFSSDTVRPRTHVPLHPSGGTCVRGRTHAPPRHESQTVVRELVHVGHFRHALQDHVVLSGDVVRPWRVRICCGFYGVCWCPHPRRFRRTIPERRPGASGIEWQGNCRPRRWRALLSSSPSHPAPYTRRRTAAGSTSVAAPGTNARVHRVSPTRKARSSVSSGSSSGTVRPRTHVPRHPFQPQNPIHKNQGRVRVAKWTLR